MKTTDAQALHFTDCVLTMDACHWFSPRYSGYSSRTELWLMSLLFFVLMLFPGMWFEEAYPLVWMGVETLADILIFLPLFVRRARQLGSVDFGVVVAAVHMMPPALMLFCFLVHGEGGLLALEFFEGLFYAANAVVLFPLYFIGGRFAGRKNALHRAAIAGDAEACARVLAYFPAGLFKRSEKGYTPREYAEKAGHFILADWFREQEAARAAEADASVWGGVTARFPPRRRG